MATQYSALLPRASGLYDPRFEHDACGVGFVARLSGQAGPRHRRQSRRSGRQSQPPRRSRRRRQERRRLGRPDPDSRGACSLAKPSAWAWAASTTPTCWASACSSCPRRTRSAQSERCIDVERSRAPVCACSAGATYRSTPTQLGEAARSTLPRIRQALIVPLDAEPQPRRLRARSVPGPQRHRALRRARRPDGPRLLRRFAVEPHAGLQRPVRRASAAGVLSRPARSRLRERPGRLPPALQHQHLPDLAAGPAVPTAGPQRRDQHAARQSRLDAGPRSAPASRRPTRHLAGGLRLDQPRRSPAPARTLRAQRAARAERAHAHRLGRQHGVCRRRCRRSIATTRRWSSRGTVRPAWRSRTAATSARRSTATACGRAATKSPPKAWWSRARKSGRSSWTITASSKRAASGRARCSRWTSNGTRSCTTPSSSASWRRPSRGSRGSSAALPRVRTRRRAAPAQADDVQPLATLQRALGYSSEDLKIVLRPMGAEAQDAVWSMGDDTPDRAVRPFAAPGLRLLPPALRPGHQSADRPAARVAGDEPAAPGSARNRTCCRSRAPSKASIELPSPVIDEATLARPAQPDRSAHRRSGRHVRRQRRAGWSGSRACTRCARPPKPPSRNGAAAADHL